MDEDRSELVQRTLVRGLALLVGIAVVIAIGTLMLVKVLGRRENTVKLYASATRGEGETVWMQPVPEGDEPALDAYVERSRRIDPDIWVVEIEDGQGRHFLTEPVESR